MKISISLLALLFAGCAASQIQYVQSSRVVATRIPVVCINQKDVITEQTARQIERVNIGVTKLRKQRTKCRGKR